MHNDPVLPLLADGAVHSGTALGVALGLSRAAVWKHLQRLQELGLSVEALPGRGYRLHQPLDLLNSAQINADLQRAGVAVSHLHIAQDLGSTNSYLLDLPKRTAAVLDGNTTPCLDICLAERQSAGRGRRGRHWHSPFAANIYLSMRREFSQGMSALGGLSLVVGIAVAETIQALGVSAVRLKWPNDIRIDGSKCGGILIELSGEAGGPCHVVIGIGLNVFMQAGTADIDQPWTSIAQHAPLVKRSALAASLIAAIDQALRRFDQCGFSAFVERYQALDEFTGKAVRILGLNEALEGIVSGVDEHGALRLQTATGLRKVHAGEVSLRAP